MLQALRSESPLQSPDRENRYQGNRGREKINPADAPQPVERRGKAELGADVVQQVNGSIGQPAGTILWEFNRTKAWSDGLLSKLRDDQLPARPHVLPPLRRPLNRDEPWPVI
jgi:hypothetical protein